MFLPEHGIILFDFYQKIRNTLPPENNKKQAFIPKDPSLRNSSGNPLDLFPILKIKKYCPYRSTKRNRIFWPNHKNPSFLQMITNFIEVK